MKLQHKIKSYFKAHDFHLWKDLRFDNGLNFVHPTDEILIEIASCLNHMKPCATLEDKRFRMKENSAIVFDSIDKLTPWLLKVLKADFDETSRESIDYGWEFRYEFKPHKTSTDSFCLSTALTSVRKRNSHCVYTLVSIRKFSGRYYCWTF